jgi:branched-chain amino acid transport system substrate-binding protein
MRKLLMKAGVPLVAGAVLLTGFSGVSFASAKHPDANKPTFDLAFEGPLSGGNAQLGLNEAYAVEYAINQANAGKSQFGKLPFTLKYVSKDDQGEATISPTDAQELVANPLSSPSSARLSPARPRRLNRPTAPTTSPP